jgi:hypothetical protein
MRKMALFIALCAPGFSAVVTVRVADRGDVENGRPFGTAGAYERISARAYFAVDPNSPANKNIVDLALAPRNEDGRVEFSADVVVYKPRDPKRGNGTALLEIPNRGGIGVLNMFQHGDSFLFEQGFTIVDVGWQFDVPEAPGRLRLSTPIAANTRGLVRGQFIPDRKVTTFIVSDRNHIPYGAIDTNERTATLTVRDRPESAPRVIPRSEWRFEDRSHVEYAKGFDPGKIYEVIYTVENSPIAGLGPAAVRDFISFLKYGGGNSTALLGDQKAFIKRAIGFGTSQSGRFLRTFLYDGFNADEKSRKVFDGVWAHVAGAGRGSFNLRFAQPSRDQHPFFNLWYPTDLFPFTDLPERDPETGVSAGLLDRVTATTMPKIFYTNGSYEYWGRDASLIHTTADALQDAPLANETRIYFLAGTQHGPGAKPARNGTQNLTNPTDYRWAMRALLADFQSWLKDGVEPPESQYPRIGKDQLVQLGAVQFPKIPAIQFPKIMGHAYHLDFSTEPPKIGKPFPTLVPQVDRDGNETSGIRLPELQAPLATYTGWNLRDSSIGAPDQLFSMAGSFIPFAKTRAERQKSGDSRPSIEERYKDKADYLSQVSKAAASLAQSRLILESDIPTIQQSAAERWDAVTK